jgi:hypothetical protein
VSNVGGGFDIDLGADLVTVGVDLVTDCGTEVGVDICVGTGVGCS